MPVVAVAPSMGTVGPGGQAVYTVTLSNPTASALTLTPTVAGLPSGWAVTLNRVTVPAGWSYSPRANDAPVNALSLAPYVMNSADLWLVVTPALTATAADYPVSVTVQSRNDPTVGAVASATLHVTPYGVQVSIAPRHTAHHPGSDRYGDVAGRGDKHRLTA